MSSIADSKITSSYHLLSKQEVAKLLGYTTRTIDRLVAARKIPFTYLPSATGSGHNIRFISTEIDTWVRGGSVVVVAGEEY